MRVFPTLIVSQHDTIFVDAVGPESAWTGTASISVEHLESGDAGGARTVRTSLCAL
jgi:hypothetical protein